MKAIFARYKPHLSMLLYQFCVAIVYLITEAAFNQGLNPHVYVTYRMAIGGFLLIPFAYFIERNSRPKLTLALFLELFFVSILGIGLNSNMYFISMRCTSPTFITSVFNTVPSLTFVIAIMLRMEIVNVKSGRGIAKILGTLISLAGAMAITLYKGPALQSLWGAPIHMKRLPSIHENWVLGPILTVVCCLHWASWLFFQARILKKFPAQLSLSTWFNLIGGAESAVFAVSLQHKSAAWCIRMFSIDFWAIVYSGIVGSALVTFLQVWCMKVKGPVFVATFSPLQTVIVAVLAYFVLGEKLYTGSILGGIIVIIGLYILLWGKERDHSYTSSQDQSSDVIKAANQTVQEIIALAENEEP